jgi:hypothetical protein
MVVDIAHQYRDDKHWQQIIAYVTILSVFICCLGLLGLSYLAARQRTEEIGIRKVLGAGVAGYSTGKLLFPVRLFGHRTMIIAQYIFHLPYAIV